ncbi:hypothetical protein SADUNF_Sadunf17G0034800 [Salix dunnii]|uniref:Uncharacterized protein n=1 Tax=Salix dunnii TaxID=1413687 RepID=A0A835J6B5_9ROSI|nr:hypothetical protein SADUNF_Sadunf17G0034800 [Salix dunnii]
MESLLDGGSLDFQDVIEASIKEFRKSSYGIATLTAGSLDFQDVIPRPRLSSYRESTAWGEKALLGVQKEKEKEGCNTRTSEVTHPSTTLAQARFSEFDGIRCISVGMIAPISTCEDEML